MYGNKHATRRSFWIFQYGPGLVEARAKRPGQARITHTGAGDATHTGQNLHCARYKNCNITSARPFSALRGIGMTNGEGTAREILLAEDNPADV